MKDCQSVGDDAWIWCIDGSVGEDESFRIEYWRGEFPTMALSGFDIDTRLVAEVTFDMLPDDIERIITALQELQVIMRDNP